MAQFKKKEIRDAVLAGAYTLFRKNRYTQTSMSDIARAAGVSASNIYVYFESKLDILFAIYDPWLRSRLLRLEEELAEIPDSEARLRHIFQTLWRDIPQEDSGFANNLMEALSTAGSNEGYSRELLLWAEERVSQMIRACLPRDRAALTDDLLLAHVIFMALDGFVMNSALRGPSRRIDPIIDLMVSLLLGRPRAPSRQAPSGAKSARPAGA